MWKLNTILLTCFVYLAVEYVQAYDDNGQQFLEDKLEHYSKRLEYNPDDLIIGDMFRELCRTKNQFDYCIDELIRIQKMHPRNINVKYQLALSYIDKVPGHSLFKQGWLSSRSMSQMTDVLNIDSNNWAAYYIRGLNSMYWPVSFKKLPKGIEDLHKAIDISTSLPDGLVTPYHLLAYIALGDAYVKSGDIEEARNIYKDSQKIMSSAKIIKRLSMNDEELSSFVKKIRNADYPVDTDISFLIDGGREKL